MKTFLLSVLGAAVLAAGCSPAPPRDETQAAGEFVTLLAQGKTAAAVRRFDENMKVVLPQPKLQQVWDMVVAGSGRFRQAVRTRTDNQAGHPVIYVTGEFERGLVDIKLVFDSQKRISGLFFAPLNQGAVPFASAAYVRPEQFREEAVTLGQGKWALPGTLSLPVGTGPFPALILVHGFGACDRDETVGPNKPFRDLAGGLASRGIAVLRYDKRTRVHSAEFSAEGSLFTVKDEIIDDALEAAALLRRTEGIDPRRIYLLGHSLGGMMIPRIGKLDTNFAGFVVMAAATPASLEDRMIEQTAFLQSLPESAAPELQKQFEETKAALLGLKSGATPGTNGSAMVLGAPPAYWLDLRGYVPAEAAKELACRVLILHGARDYQVPMSDYEIWRQALGSRTNVVFKLYPALNHLMVPGEGPSTPAEYMRPGHVSGEVIEDIAQWIFKPGASSP